MIKSRFRAPYKAKNQTSLPEIKEKSGVYIIKENGVIVYVGFSGSNLYRTLYRHFERWNHKTQPVVSYQSRYSRNSYTVRVILCTPAKAAKLERALVIKHAPRDNKEKYDNHLFNNNDQKLIKEYDEAKINTDPIPF